MGRETNKQRRERQAQSAREKAAAARAQQQRVAQRRRAMSILGSIVVVAVVGAIIAVVAINAGGNKKSTRLPLSPAVINAVTSVAPADLQTIGKGSATQLTKPATGQPPLTSNGKPELLYVGGEFCPFCAAERWSLIQALSRFGTFSGLHQIRSTEENLATFTFYKSTYTSKYLTFTPVENEDGSSPQPKPLVNMTSAQQAIFTKYTTGYPFLYFGGKFYQTNAGYDPSDLSGMTWQQIATQLKTPSSKVAQAILGESNLLTATICQMTGNKPANVCTSSITALQQPAA